MVSILLPAFICQNEETQRNPPPPFSLSPEKSMSLLTSIFGETGWEQQQPAGSSSTVKDNDGTYNLFGPKVIDVDAAMAPPVVHKSRSKSTTGKRAVIKATTTSGEGANDVALTDEDVGRIATSKGGETNMGGEGVANLSQIPEEEGEEGEEEAKMAINEKTTKVAVGARNKSREEDEDEKSRTVFAGNLPPDISCRALANMFKTCGIVSSLRLRSLAVTGVKLPPQTGRQSGEGGGYALLLIMNIVTTSFFFFSRGFFFWR
jgi:hypothetical protein